MVSPRREGLQKTALKRALNYLLGSRDMKEGKGLFRGSLENEDQDFASQSFIWAEKENIQRVEDEVDHFK